MLRTTLMIALLALSSAGLAAAQDPVFYGPELYDGAWTVTHAWSDSAAGPGDRSKGSFAWAYREWALRRAQAHADAGTRLDCADLSIDMIVEYAAANGLPIEWRAWHSPEKKFIKITNADRQFDTPADFARWSKWFLGAQNLADNTVKVTYETWAGGDMVLMDWNQTDVEPNFEGREVWHTYLIGVPDQLVFYGNESGVDPLPVIGVTSPTTLDRVRNHPDIHEHAPRRFRFLANAVWGPETSTETATVRATNLNLRDAPASTGAVLGQAHRGERYPVLGRDGLWLKLQLADGRAVWAHGMFLQTETVSQPVAAAPASPGLVSAVGH